MRPWRMSVAHGPPRAPHLELQGYEKKKGKNHHLQMDKRLWKRGVREMRSYLNQLNIQSQLEVLKL